MVCVVETVTRVKRCPRLSSVTQVQLVSCITSPVLSYIHVIYSPSTGSIRTHKFTVPSSDPVICVSVFIGGI